VAVVHGGLFAVVAEEGLDARYPVCPVVWAQRGDGGCQPPLRRL
jgi:hypothetical protein